MNFFMNDSLLYRKNQFQVVKHLEVDSKQYHNTKLLLELYNKVLWRLENSFKWVEETCVEETGKTMGELIGCLIEAEVFISESRVESRLQSIEDSRNIIKLIDQGLLMLKDYPDQGERYYWIINKVYISKSKCSEIEMMSYLCCSRATYFREKKKAIRLFGTILWGYLFPTVINEIKSLNHLAV